jgi:hypothetical protein
MVRLGEFSVSLLSGVRAGNRFVLAAGDVDRSFWSVDGSGAMKKLRTFQPFNSVLQNQTLPKLALAAVGDVAVGAAWSGEGMVIYRIDPALGTVQELADLGPQAIPDNFGVPVRATTLHGRAVVVASSGVWTSDGTMAGTRPLVQTEVKDATVGVDRVYVVSAAQSVFGDNPGPGTLWETDGTEAGMLRAENFAIGGVRTTRVVGGVGNAVLLKRDAGFGIEEFWSVTLGAPPQAIAGRIISSSGGKITGAVDDFWVRYQTGLVTHVRAEVDGVRSAVEALANETPQDAGVGGSGFTWVLPPLETGFHDVRLTFSDVLAGVERDIGRVRVYSGSPYFSERFYLEQNPDVAAALAAGLVADGWTHFENRGHLEGRSPSKYFETAYYLSHNADVAAAVAAGAVPSAWTHFVAAGAREGRAASPYFQESFYLAGNPDVASAVAARAGASGLAHFMTRGQFEGRTGVAVYDPERWYAVKAADDDRRTLGAFEHFLKDAPALPETGAGDFVLTPFWAGAGPWYDEAYYLKMNPDVQAAVTSKTFASGLEHFLRAGLAERRQAAPLYSERAYLANNGDVAAAVVAGRFRSGMEHWVLAGRFEGRGGV